MTFGLVVIFVVKLKHKSAPLQQIPIMHTPLEDGYASGRCKASEMKNLILDFPRDTHCMTKFFELLSSIFWFCLGKQNITLLKNGL